MKLRTTFLILLISLVSLEVSVIAILMTHILSLMGVLSPTTSNEVADILVSVWVPIGLGLIILIYCTEHNPSSISNDQTHVPDDHTAKQLNVTGTAQMTDSSFTMDLRLSETQSIMKPLPDTKTETQQQLSKDV
jgi:hypothetical protein